MPTPAEPAAARTGDVKMQVPLLDLKRQWKTIREEALRRVTQVLDEQSCVLGPAVTDLEKAVLIQISPLQLKLEGEVLLGDKDPEEMNNLSNENVDSKLVVGPLASKLAEKREEFLKANPDKKDDPGQVIIQADSSVKYLAITRVMMAAADNGFQRINLAIEAKSADPE